MKVLIISHNPIGTQVNMGKTLYSLFSSFKKEELCQLYVYPAVPDIDVCSSYFRVTDKDVLRSFYTFKLNCGEIAVDCSNHNMYENPDDEKLYANSKNRSDVRLLLRDFMWKAAHWYNNSLKKWLEKEKPTCIFVAAGMSTFIYNIALKISKKLSIPIVTYICDDYYFVNTPKAMIARFRNGFLKKEMRRLMKKTSELVVICETLKKQYSEEFSVSTTKIMTGSNFIPEQQSHIFKEPTTLSFFGNICCNRYTSLLDIGKMLERINNQKGINLQLNIYTAEKNPDIIKSFSDIKSVNICPFISGDEFKTALLSSELLLHVEAFDDDSIDLVKHSISTKIPDSLASGVPFVAYGPASVASIDYLLSEECAIVATSNGELENVLQKAFFDETARNTVAKKAIVTAQKNHSNIENSNLLKQILLNI